MVRRREILRTALVLAAGQLTGADLVEAAAAATAPQPVTRQSAAATGSGPAKRFDYAWLKGQARFLAGNPYQTSKDVLPASMAALSYDQYQSLRFRSDHALWGDGGLPFRLQIRVVRQFPCFFFYFSLQIVQLALNLILYSWLHWRAPSSSDNRNDFHATHSLSSVAPTVGPPGIGTQSNNKYLDLHP